MRIIVCPFRLEDVDHACSMLRQAMPEKEYTRTIFACDGYNEYLRASCRCGERSSTHLIGAYIEDRLVGFAEWRRLDQMVVLNNLMVETDFRSRGVGGRLVAYGEELARKDGVRTMALDVFSWNESAYAWYLRLGFEEAGRTYWYEGALRTGEESLEPLDPAAAASPCIIDEYPIAEAHHAAYGFSSLKLRTPSGTVQIGRLGNKLFRIQAKGRDWDEGGRLLYYLAELDADRDVLLLTPEPNLHLAESGLVLITESIRMIKSVEKEAVYR
ncbi:GNAT family N-acetyltransferase [Paenibacillus koleovorans]|uniref:GNAT family N-acetyltransferase n=1 Tax=Paenibacillus koleovorans TaxID=121608 RepID=UPI0013E33CB7|nr:GNAT family N-acetyltransferase [Paenibacillus koleovorans]